MKIKRFVAESMREALAQVRAEQGPDAVIITNRRIEGGIELITAIDYDESLIEEALARARPAPSAPAAPVEIADEPVVEEPRARESLRERAMAAIGAGRRGATPKPRAAASPVSSTAGAPVSKSPAAPAPVLDGSAGRAAKAKAAAERAAFAAQLARVVSEEVDEPEDASERRYDETMVLPAAAAVAARGTARAPAAPAAPAKRAATPAPATAGRSTPRTAAVAPARSLAPVPAPAVAAPSAAVARASASAAPANAAPVKIAAAPARAALAPSAPAPATPAVTPPAPGAAVPAAPRPAPRTAPSAASAGAASTAARPQMVWSQDPELVTMRREVEGLRQLLQDQLSSLAWSDRLRREPVRARVLRDLSEIGIAADVARTLAERVPADADGTEPWRLALALLMKHVPTVDDGLLAKGGTFAVVGPTGVGKTTTIAKLAARYALAHGARDVALVSLDHYRIGARDQLLTFARILGVTMHVATNARELAGVLASLADRRLVLVDTAGMSPRDDRLAAQFATLAVPGARIRTLLAIAANSEHRALDGIARSYAPARPEAILLTKLDEAASFGAALSVAMRHGLPLAQLCDGQRVPEDLHAAPAKRVWLVRQAHKLASSGRTAGGIDDAYMAEHFGKVANHG